MKTSTAICALVLVAMAGCSKKQSEAQNQQAEVREIAPPREITSFDPLLGPSAVITANAQEFDGAILTLSERNRLRKSNARMTFRSIAPGIKKVTWNVRRGQTLHQATVFVINAGNAEHQRVLRYVPRNECRIVTLRGHTSDMAHLRRYAEPFMHTNCFLILGGCASTQFVREFYAPNRPVMGDSGIAEAANNTYLLIRTIDLIGGQRVSTWEEFAAAISSDSARAYAQTIIPGQANYRTHFR